MQERGRTGSYCSTEHKPQSNTWYAVSPLADSIPLNILNTVRILAAFARGSGHFLPMVPFLNEARQRGWQTLVVGPYFVASMVRTTGHAFFGDSEQSKTHLPHSRKRAAPPTPNGSLPDESSPERTGGRFMGPAGFELLAVMDQAVREWQPDLILRDPAEYSSAEVAARRGIPAVQVATSLAAYTWESFEDVAPQLKILRDGLLDELRGSPFVTRLPPSLDPSPFPATHRYREPAAAQCARLPAWWDSSDSPLVYMTFGTVVGGVPVSDRVYPAVLDAAAGLDARVLMTVGHDFDTSKLHDMPGNVHVEAWIDQASVLGEAAMVVCHSGSGTVYGALAAGVPLVVMPIWGDNMANAATVTTAGAGIEITTGQDIQGDRLLVGREDSARIRDAIETVLAAAAYRQAAQAIAAEMATAPAITTLLTQLR
jgi:UDP-glucoronosyl and UDP-glucosyl transferase